MQEREDLLRPSLGGEAGPETSIYSATTGYMAAFFGGPVGAATVALVNSWRLKRLASDWPLAAGAIALTVALLWWELRAGGTEWLREKIGSSGPQIALRVAGLAFFALVFAVHRRYYRSMAMLEIEAPSGWALGFGAIVVGIAATLLITTALG